MKITERVKAVVRALRGQDEPTAVEKFAQAHGCWMPGDEPYMPREGERLMRNLRGDGRTDWENLFRG
jgi:hypothetical protein